jgi:hypothetical protein
MHQLISLCEEGDKGMKLRCILGRGVVRWKTDRTAEVVSYITVSFSGAEHLVML